LTATHFFTSSYKLHKSFIKGVTNNASNSAAMFPLMPSCPQNFLLWGQLTI